MQKEKTSGGELFRLDGKPSWGQAFPQALQHVLAMLIGNITPPMLIASTLSLSAGDQIILTQAAMLIGGITTLLQLYPLLGFGMGLPNVMGVAFAYMPILTMIGTQYGISAIFGSQLVAGFVSIFIGMFMGKIRRFFPPIVSGTVVLSIGLTLYETAMNYMGGGSAAQNAGTFGSGQFWILALITLAVTLACSLFGKGYVRVSGMLIGILVGYVIALFMGGIVDFSSLDEAGWISLPRPFYFSLAFHPDAIIMMILMYVVQAVQTIGDVSSTAMGGFGREATDKELGGAIKAAVEALPDDERVVVIGSGGISHWVGTPEMGKVNEAFDYEIMDYACTGDLAAIQGLSDDYILENGGNGGMEVRQWAVAMGAMPGARGEIIDYAPVREWVTGLGFVQLFA